MESTSSVEPPKIEEGEKKTSTDNQKFPDANADLKSDEDLLKTIEDSNPKTWINEDLWRTFLVMTIFYVVSAVFVAVKVFDGTIRFDLGIFWQILNAVWLPLFGAAMRNQMMAGANRKLQDLNRAFALQKKALIDENMDLKSNLETIQAANDAMKEELYKAKADLDAKAQILEAMKGAQ